MKHTHTRKFVADSRPKTESKTDLPRPQKEGGETKVPHTTEPLDEHLVGFLISQGHSRYRAQQDVARDPEAVKKLKKQIEEEQKPQED
jgi:hypothetical protein